MNQKTESLNIKPPRMITSFIGGFNTVATHIPLILFPIFLDLFLWFGPHMRLKNVFSPLEAMINAQVAQAAARDPNVTSQSVQELWKIVMERFNLFMLLRTYPIGVPSLFASSGMIKTPFGPPPTYEMTSIGSAFLLWLLVLITGFLLGVVYFLFIGKTITPNSPSFQMSVAARQFLQMFIFVFGLWALILLLSIPLAIILTLIAIFNTSIVQIVMILTLLLAAWMIVPLVFIPHGIILYRYNVLLSAMTSMRVVRFFLPGTGLFLLIAILLSQGFDLLWTVPPENSWMAIVGVLGHAFISTSMLTASFIYYRGGVEWMRDKLQPSTANSSPA